MIPRFGFAIVMVIVLALGSAACGQEKPAPPATQEDGEKVATERRRDEMLAVADETIRAGLLELSDRFGQLKRTNHGALTEPLKSKSPAGEIRIGVGLYPRGPGKSDGIAAPVAEGDIYRVVVILKALTPPDAPAEQFKYTPLFPRLGLEGLITTSAADAKLAAALKDLVDRALLPLRKLEATAPAPPATQGDASSRIGELISAIKETDVKTVRAAVNDLGQMGAAARPAVPWLTALMDRKDTGFRTIGAWGLGRIGPEAKDAVPALVKALGDESSDTNDLLEVRKAAALALGRIGVGSKEVVSALCGRLDLDDDVSVACLNALGALGSRAADAVDIIRQKSGRYLKPYGENAILRITGKNGTNPDLVNSFIGRKATFVCRIDEHWVKGGPGVTIYTRQGQLITGAGADREITLKFPPGQWLEVEGMIHEEYMMWPIPKDYRGPHPQAGFQVVRYLDIASVKPTTSAATQPAAALTPPGSPARQPGATGTP